MRFQVPDSRFQNMRTCFGFTLTPNTRNLAPAFTLIELLAVCAIMVLISTLLLANQGKFGGQVLLQNFAYDMALSIRQAQVYGISVQSFGGNFNRTYGVHFSAPPSTSYWLFADDKNSGVPGIYDEGERLKNATYNITRQYVITDLCRLKKNSEQCGLEGLDILFQRPEPDALISWYTGSSTHECPTAQAGDCADGARIVVLSPRGETMSVKVTSSGQISVDQVVTNN